MRLNKYISDHTLLSRRKADIAVADHRVLVNDSQPEIGQQVTEADRVTLDGRNIISKQPLQTVTVLLNKPVGYVCSKNGQGSLTVYSLLPKEYQRLNIAGRLDKDSSGLVLLTNDGDLLNELTHPSNNKTKIYEVNVDKDLDDSDTEALRSGIDIGEKLPSKFIEITKLSDKTYEIILQEGRNRQIRKMFNKRHISVESLHRKSIDTYSSAGINSAKYRII